MKKMKHFEFDKLKTGKLELDYTMLPDDETGTMSVRCLEEYYDRPLLVDGVPCNQLCVVWVSENEYMIHTGGIRMPSGTSGLTIGISDEGKHTCSIWDQHEKCQYCKGTGLHHHEDRYYWLCRNCEFSGWVRKCIN